MNQFIIKPLAQEHDLNDSKIDKSLLNIKDFLKVLCCHWVTDINFFLNKHQQVQVITLLLLTAVINSHSEALLEIIYDDINLFILHNKKTEKVALTL